MVTVSNLPPAGPIPERRRFFRWMTYGFGAIATATVGIPFIGYLFGVRKAPVVWQPLGPVTDFPENQTRRVTFDNPIRQPWDGMVARISVYVRREEGASLAIQVAPVVDGLRIIDIVEGSTAAEAGLQKGDVLTTLDGKPVSDQNALASILLDKQPGQIVALTRHRASEKKEVKIKLDPRLLVLAANCAHLGCPVEWFQESGLFMCPCHGGVYYASGERASGPPPRGLFSCIHRITRHRHIEQLEIQAPHFPTLQDTLQHPA